MYAMDSWQIESTAAPLCSAALQASWRQQRYEIFRDPYDRRTTAQPRTSSLCAQLERKKEVQLSSNSRPAAGPKCWEGSTKSHDFRLFARLHGRSVCKSPRDLPAAFLPLCRPVPQFQN
jgi:hypothetical protein